MTLKDLRSLIDYWFQGSDYDWETAGTLFRGKKYPYCLFMCHLSLEKLLKALIVKETKDHAPFTHNLSYLAGKLSIEFSKERIVMLGEMSEFNMEARYPDEKKAFYRKASKQFAKDYMKATGAMRSWLKEMF